VNDIVAVFLPLETVAVQVRIDQALWLVLASELGFKLQFFGDNSFGRRSG